MGSVGREDDHHHQAAADGNHPKKAHSGNASTTWGKSLGPVPAAKGIGGAVNVPPKHKACLPANIYAGNGMSKKI